MKTKTHFTFRVDIWDDAGDSIVEHVAGVDGSDLPSCNRALARGARITLRQGALVVHETGQGSSTMPRPRSKPTNPKVIEAAVETARQYLTRLIIDAVPWNMQGIGPTDGPESRREHAIAFVTNALLPGATASMRNIARNVALPIITHEVADGRSSPNARRDQILVGIVELVCKTHNLHPTRRSGQAESGCSIVAMALPKFLAWLHKYPNEQLCKLPERPELFELRKFVSEVPKLAEKLFPEGALSEQRINNIWDKRTQS